MATRISRQLASLKNAYPWISTPIVVSAPMRLFAGPAMAAAVYRAGGIGFIGPGPKPSDLDNSLVEARRTLNIPLSKSLPVGVGFQTFDADLDVAIPALEKHKPAAVWLFASRDGQKEFDLWIKRIKEASPSTQIWIQVGSVVDALKAVRAPAPPDVLVVQGIDAGGHGLVRGAGFISMLPELADAIKDLDIPLFAAGGIADGRGVAAALSLGAAGAVMGTRFLAAKEAKISRGYQQDVLRVSDGGQNTVRTQMYDKMAGRDDWPPQYDGRNIVNKTILDHDSGMDVVENKKLYSEAMKKGDDGWGPEGRLTAYVGSAVGLVKEVIGAEDIVKKSRDEAVSIIRQTNSRL